MRVERIGDATLYLADNREVELPRADALISDPPYGMAANTDSKRFTGGNSGINRGQGRDDWGAIAEDAGPFDPAPWLQAAPKCVLWGANHYAQRLPVGRTLIWLKKHPDLFGTFLSDAEIGWATGGHGVWAFYKQFPPPSRMAESGNGAVAHPTQKPVELMAWCLDLVGVKPGETVFDPYMGSGSTGAACARRGVRFVGCEIDPRYFDAACRRIEAAHSQGALALGAA